MKLLKTNYFVPLTTVILALLLSIMLDKYSIFLANSTPSGMATTMLITSASMCLSMSLLYPHTLSLLSLYLHHRAGGEYSDHRIAVSGVLVGAEERETGLRDHCVCRELTPENHQESGETGWGESPHTISIQMVQTYFFLQNIKKLLLNA